MCNHQTCHVKIPIHRKQSFAIKSPVIPDIGVVHNNNAYISENIVWKHTSAKFDLVICKNEVNRKVQVGKDQEKAQSEKDSHSKNRGGKKPN